MTANQRADDTAVLEHESFAPDQPAPPPGLVPAPVTDLRRVLLALDGVALLVGWVVGTLLAGWSVLATAAGSVPVVAGGLAVLGSQGLYLSRICSVRAGELARLLSSGALIAAGLFAAGAALELDLDLGLALTVTLMQFGSLVILRAAFRGWVGQQRSKGRFLRPVLLIGTNAEARALLDLVSRHPEFGTRIVGVVGNPAEAALCGIDPDLHVGPIAVTTRELRRTGATGAIIAVSAIPTEQLNGLTRTLVGMGAHVQLTSGLRGIDHRRLRSQTLASEPIYYVERAQLRQWQIVVKRSLDIVLSLAGLVLTTPVIWTAMLLIKLSDDGNVFIRERRVGAEGRTIVVSRLRTTVEEATLREEWSGPAYSGELTRFGRILEATSINELPQLWSVLRGDLSLVGPRPPLVTEVAEGLAHIPALRPGVTGLWKTEDRSPTLEDHVRLDDFYVENWSIMLDLVLLAASVEPLLTRVVCGASERRRRLANGAVTGG